MFSEGQMLKKIILSFYTSISIRILIELLSSIFDMIVFFFH